MKNGFCDSLLFETLAAEKHMPQDRKLWAAALRDVQSHILSTMGETTLTFPQKKAIWAVHGFCRERIEDGPPSPAPTNRELASKYGVSLRTVTNWRREGCPFHKGQANVLNWLSERRYAPAGAREKFSEQLAKRKRPPFMYRGFRAALDQARQFKRDCIDHGEEPPEWTKGFRATRRTKGIPTGKRAKSRKKAENRLNRVGR